MSVHLAWRCTCEGCGWSITLEKTSIQQVVKTLRDSEWQVRDDHVAVRCLCPTCFVSGKSLPAVQA